MGKWEDLMKEGCWAPKFLQLRYRLIKLLSCKRVPTFRGQNWDPKDKTYCPESYSQTLKPDAVYLAGFQIMNYHV